MRIIKCIHCDEVINGTYFDNGEGEQLCELCGDGFLIPCEWGENQYYDPEDGTDPTSHDCETPIYRRREKK